MSYHGRPENLPTGKPISKFPDQDAELDNSIADTKSLNSNDRNLHNYKGNFVNILFIDQDPPQRPSNEVCVDYGQEDADQDVVIPADGGGSQPIVINYENEEDKHSQRDGGSRRDSVSSHDGEDGPGGKPKAQSTIVDVNPDCDIIIEDSEEYGDQLEQAKSEIHEIIDKGLDTVHENSNEEQTEGKNQELDKDLSSSGGGSSSDKKETEITFMNGWRRKVKLSDVVRLGLLPDDIVAALEAGTLEPDEVGREYLPEFLFGEDPVAGIYHTDTQEKKSIFKSAKEGTIRRGTAISLLEAQAATGNIIDPDTGRKMSVAEAAEVGLLDKLYETILARAERAVHGYKTTRSTSANEPEEIVSLFEAMSRGIIVESHAIRLLEAQLATGGIIDPRTNMRYGVDLAIQQGIFSEELKEELHKSKGFFDPNSQEYLTYSELLSRAHIDEETGCKLLPFIPQTLHSRANSKISITGSQTGEKSKSSSHETQDKIVHSDSEASETKESKPPTDDEDEERTKASASVDKSKSIKSKTSETKSVQSSVDKKSRSSQHSKDPSKDIITEEDLERKSIHSAKSHEIIEEVIEEVIEGSLASGDEYEEVIEVIEEYIDEEEDHKETHEEVLRIEEKMGDRASPQDHDQYAQEVQEGDEEELDSDEYTYEMVEVEVLVNEDGEEIPMEPGDDVSYEEVEYIEEEIIEEDPEAEAEAEREMELQSRENERKKSEESRKSITINRSVSTKSKKVSERVSRSKSQKSKSDVDHESKDLLSDHESLNSSQLIQDGSTTKDTDTIKQPSIEIQTTSKLRKQQTYHGSVRQRRTTSQDNQLSGYSSEDNLEHSTGGIADVKNIPSVSKGQRRNRADINFANGWGGYASLESLLSANLITERTVIALEEGKLTEEEVAPLLAKYLIGDSPVAGVFLTTTGQKMSVFEAAHKGYIRRGTAISMLEAQACNGSMLDPVNGIRLSIKDAVENGLIDAQYSAVLERAHRAVLGYTSRFTAQKVLSAHQAIEKGLIVKNHAARLLEAQIATGGLIDPVAGHRVPILIAEERGMFSQDMAETLKASNDDSRGFFDPNTDDNLTYAELLTRCVTDNETGFKLLPYEKDVKVGQSINSNKILFESEFRKVTLQDVVEAELIEPPTLIKFQNGEMSSNEMKQLIETLKEHVEGTVPIAGILNPGDGSKMSIYDAAEQGIIRKGAAFELLEAQAACGKIIDVNGNKIVTFENACKSGVFKADYITHVERAQRAFDGYKEPFKKDILSVCEAIDRHLIVERYGIRLIEAQMATGGIVDSRSPLRLSVDAAVRKGFCDEELAEKLRNQSTKSYFDPNTGTNLHYSQLMQRCWKDPETGFLYLEVEAGSRSKAGSQVSSIPTIRTGVAAAAGRSFSPEKSEKDKSGHGPTKAVLQTIQHVAHDSAVTGLADPEEEDGGIHRGRRSKKKKRKKTTKQPLHEVEEMLVRKESTKRGRSHISPDSQTELQKASPNASLAIEDEVGTERKDKKKKRKKDKKEKRDRTRDDVGRSHYTHKTGSQMEDMTDIISQTPADRLMTDEEDHHAKHKKKKTKKDKKKKKDRKRTRSVDDHLDGDSLKSRASGRSRSVDSGLRGFGLALMARSFLALIFIYNNNAQPRIP